MEFNAKQAREISKNHEKIKNEKMYEKLKWEIFSSIQKVALEGYDNLFIEREWSASFKSFLAIKLMALGYRVKINDNNMEISWEERK